MEQAALLHVAKFTSYSLSQLKATVSRFEPLSASEIDAKAQERNYWLPVSNPEAASAQITGYLGDGDAENARLENAAPGKVWNIATQVY